MAADITFISAQLSSTTTPALTTAYAVRPAYSDGSVMLVAKQGLARTATQTFFAKAARAGAGTFTGITIKAQISDDGLNPTDATAANWTDILLEDLAVGAASLAIEHTLSPGAGATAYKRLGTTSARNAPYMRVLMKATGGAAAAGESGTVQVFAS